jgi:hypothetical protein
MSWFSTLTGIETETPQSVREILRIEASHLISKANFRQFDIGVLTMPLLSDLRMIDLPEDGPISVREVVADVQELHTLPINSGAAFQVASQFNLLEMVGPSITPEDGVGRYEYDQTQGPACAIACGAGTIYRNYFIPIQGRVGQTETCQIDCLYDIGNAIENKKNAYWVMKNGYALPTEGGLSRLNEFLLEISSSEKDRLRGLLRIGVHSDTEVTFQNAGHRVTQLFCSAMPVSYGAGTADSWKEIAKLVLEASYEATLLAARQNAVRTGNKRVFLTLLGGGAFGNKPDWIVDAILRAIGLASHSGLDINLVSYGSSNAIARTVIERSMDSRS